MQEFARLCRAHGMPLTVQRRAVLETLLCRHDHPTADEIFGELQQGLPGISRPTVYRILDTLVTIGIARKVCHPGAAARFETKVERHHHLVCVRCDKVTDFEHPPFDKLALPDTRGQGFQLDDYSIHFRGVCVECAKVNGRRGETSRPRAKGGKRAPQRNAP